MARTSYADRLAAVTARGWDSVSQRDRAVSAERERLGLDKGSPEWKQVGAKLDAERTAAADPSKLAERVAKWQAGLESKKEAAKQKRADAKARPSRRQIHNHGQLITTLPGGGGWGVIMRWLRNNRSERVAIEVEVETGQTYTGWPDGVSAGFLHHKLIEAGAPPDGKPKEDALKAALELVLEGEGAYSAPEDHDQGIPNAVYAQIEVV